MEYDEGMDDVLTYTRDSVKLVVEQQEEELVITYAQLGVEDMYHLTIELVGRMATITKEPYNNVLDDLKEITDAL